MCWRGCRSALAPADELAKSPVCHLTRRLAPGSRVGTSRSVRRPEPCDSARAQDRDSRLAVETAENTVSQANLIVFHTHEIGRAHVELQSLMRISYAVFCLKKKKTQDTKSFRTCAH